MQTATESITMKKINSKRNVYKRLYAAYRGHTLVYVLVRELLYWGKILEKEPSLGRMDVRVRLSLPRLAVADLGCWKS